MMRFAAIAAALASVSTPAAASRTNTRPSHALGMASDFKIYQEQFWAGAYEKLDQNTALFGAASNSTFVLTTQKRKGDFVQESVLKLLSGLISRRDTTSSAGLTDMKLTQDERVAVKLNRTIGPVAETYDALRKIGSSWEEVSMVLGSMVGDQMLQEYVNTAIAAASGALSGTAANNVAATGATIIHANLVDMMAKLGDNGENISCYVMHSKVYYDLMKQSITDKIFNVANVTIYQGTIATFGRPVVVIDAPALLIAGAPNTYVTLALTPGAVSVEESEEKYITNQEVTGNAQLFQRIQGEFAYNLGIKGYKWNMATAINPTAAQLVASANWPAYATSQKQLAGTRLITN